MKEEYMTLKTYENQIREYHKQFYNGNQFIQLKEKGCIDTYGNIVFDIIKLEKSYFWQERLIFNHIRPLVDTLKLKIQNLTEEDIFGEFGFVSALIPIQIAYNAVKNRNMEFLNRLTLGVLTVEDGSVDIDNLEEEGLCPGKVLVYRQGSEAPKLMNTPNYSNNYIETENQLLKNFTECFTQYKTMFEEKYKVKGEKQ